MIKIYSVRFYIILIWVFSTGLNASEKPLTRAESSGYTETSRY